MVVVVVAAGVGVLLLLHLAVGAGADGSGSGGGVVNSTSTLEYFWPVDDFEKPASLPPKKYS